MLFIQYVFLHQVIWLHQVPKTKKFVYGFPVSKANQLSSKHTRQLFDVWIFQVMVKVYSVHRKTRPSKFGRYTDKNSNFLSINIPIGFVVRNSLLMVDWSSAAAMIKPLKFGIEIPMNVCIHSTNHMVFSTMSPFIQVEHVLVVVVLMLVWKSGIFEHGN